MDCKVAGQPNTFAFFCGPSSQPLFGQRPYLATKLLGEGIRNFDCDSQHSGSRRRFPSGHGLRDQHKHQTEQTNRFRRVSARAGVELQNPSTVYLITAAIPVPLERV